MFLIVFLTIVFGILKENRNIGDFVFFLCIFSVKLVGKFTGTEVKLIIRDFIVIEVRNYFGIIGFITAAEVLSLQSKYRR